MSERTQQYTTPVSAAFEFQRTAAEQYRRAFERSIDLQRDVNDALVDGFDDAERGQRTGVEFAHRSILASLDAVEAGVPGSAGAVDEIRRTVDEQFDLLLDAHEEAFDAAKDELERNVESYDELTEEYLDALDEQFDLLLELHRDLETSTVETFDRTLEQYERVQSEMDAQAVEFREQFEAQSEEFQRQFEEQLDRFRQQLEEMQARLDEPTTRTTEA